MSEHEGLVKRLRNSVSGPHDAGAKYTLTWAASGGDILTAAAAIEALEARALAAEGLLLTANHALSAWSDACRVDALMSGPRITVQQTKANIAWPLTADAISRIDAFLAGRTETESKDENARYWRRRSDITGSGDR